MMSRTAIKAARLSATLFSTASLVLFIFVLLKVMDYRTHASQVWISSFPVIGLSISILWNVLACSLIVFLNYIWVLAIDIIAAVLLAVLGIIGFVHDDTSYLDNGQWLEDSMFWFDIEIAGITILGVSFVIQLLVIILCIKAREQSFKQTDFEGPILPPPYVGEKNEGYKGDWQSFASSEVVVVEEEKKKKGKSI